MIRFFFLDFQPHSRLRIILLISKLHYEIQRYYYVPNDMVVKQKITIIKYRTKVSDENRDVLLNIIQRVSVKYLCAIFINL